MKTQNSQTSTHYLYSRFFVAIVVLLATIVNIRADYQSIVLGDNPLAYYPLDLNVDTGSTVTDLSGNGNTAIAYNLSNVPGPSPFITNAANFVPGYPSYVDLGSGTNSLILNFSGPITMEAWVQPASPTVGGGPPADIIAKGYDEAQSANELVLRCNGGYYYGGTFNNTNGGASAHGGVQTTNWTYLVSTYDETNWNLYVNGHLVGQGADTVGAINFPDAWRIGDGTADGATTLRLFEGNITQVALYTNALSLDQVLVHFFMGEVGVMPSNSVPIITDQPQPQSAYAGGIVTFSANSVSPLVTTNQWYKKGVLISGQTNTSLTLTNVQSGDATNYSVRFGNSKGSTNSVSVSLTLLSAGDPLQWSGANSAIWDAGVTANWTNLSSGLPVVFNTGDTVLFDDTPGVPTNVNVSGTIAAGVITVNSSTNNFLINGTGPLAGPGSLIKQGASILTLNVPVSSFTGPVMISGGKVVAGYYAFANSASITITNNSTLDFNGSTMINHTPITVSGNGMGGAGAIVNSAFDLYGQVLNITLAGDTTFGGGNRWDLGVGSQISGAHNLMLNWSYGEWNTVTIGANVTGITLTNGNFGSKNMDTTFQNPGTVFTVSTNCQLVFWNGGWNGSIHLLSGGQIYHYTAPAGFYGSNIILEDGAQLISYGNTGATTPINSAITLNGVAHFVIGDHNMVYTNLISGTGGFVADYWNHQMVLSASNTYSGPTVISSSGNSIAVALNGNGSISHSSLIFFGGNDSTSVRLDVSGRPDKTLTLANGQTLGGIGTINGSLTVAAGATLSPAGTNTTIGITAGANTTGTISVTNTVVLNGTTTLKLNGSGVNDEVQAGAGITYGGTLNLVNISGATYAVGNLFQVFSAASYTGSFASITPAKPATGMAWGLTNGFLSVVAAPSQPVVNSVRVSSGNLIFSGTNGTASNSYSVLTTTNLTTPLTNWTSLVTNSFDGTGAFSVTNAISGGTPQRFYTIKLVP